MTNEEATTRAREIVIAGMHPRVKWETEDYRLKELISQALLAASQVSPSIKVREALEFYARTKNWGSLDTSRATGNKVYDICCFDFSRDLKKGKDYAGKRAREALALLGDE